MFSKSADLYDIIYRATKDYESEVSELDRLLGLLDPKPKALLDVGCGTGEHAQILSSKFGYAVDGIDIEPGLIEIAARKNPEGDFTVADMAQFSLPKRYDAILCLFSSLAYVETEERLRMTAQCLASCCDPGAWLLIESWYEPEAWQDSVDATEAIDEQSGTKILRAREGKREGDVSILTLDYHVERGGEQLDFTETHRLGLFSKSQITNAFQEVGFEIGPPSEGSVYVGCYLPKS